MTLRSREIAAAANDIAAKTGLTHRPVGEGEQVSVVCRQSIQLGSGRFAMLDDGMVFSLVQWRPVIEQRMWCVVIGQLATGAPGTMTTILM